MHVRPVAVRFARSCVTAACLLGLVLVVSPVGFASAQSKSASQAMPEGEMRWALYVTLSPASYGNAASRISEHVPSAGTYAYGGYPDIDALYQEQALVTDRKKRETLLHQIQQLVHERVRFGLIWDYIWLSGVGPRVEEPALMLINPYPWSAPLEEVRLKRK